VNGTEWHMVVLSHNYVQPWLT